MQIFGNVALPDGRTCLLSMYSVILELDSQKMEDDGFDIHAIVGLNSWPSACRSDCLQVPKFTLLSVRGFTCSEKCDTGAQGVSV